MFGVELGCLRERASAAKAACMAASNGTAEAVPYPKRSRENLIRDFPSYRRKR